MAHVQLARGVRQHRAGIEFLLLIALGIECMLDDLIGINRLPVFARSALDICRAVFVLHGLIYSVHLATHIFGVGDETDFCHAIVLRGCHHLRNDLIAGGLISAQLKFWLRLFLRSGCEPCA